MSLSFYVLKIVQIALLLSFLLLYYNFVTTAIAAILSTCLSFRIFFLTSKRNIGYIFSLRFNFNFFFFFFKIKLNVAFCCCIANWPRILFFFSGNNSDLYANTWLYYLHACVFSYLGYAKNAYEMQACFFSFAQRSYFCSLSSILFFCFCFS